MGTFGVKRASDEPFCPITSTVSWALIEGYSVSRRMLLVFDKHTPQSIGTRTSGTYLSLPRIPPPADILLEFSPNIRLTEVFLAKTGE